jgi:ribose 5-phosphate isomerase B
VEIALGSDHAGFALKEAVKRALVRRGFAPLDLGTSSDQSVDYSDFAHDLARRVGSGEVERGILVCGSGQGMAMSANRHRGVRAALAWDEESARLAREHNDANVLALPGRRIDEESAMRIVNRFLTTDFSGGRHTRRVAKIEAE